MVEILCHHSWNLLPMQALVSLVVACGLVLLRLGQWMVRWEHLAGRSVIVDAASFLDACFDLDLLQKRRV